MFPGNNPCKSSTPSSELKEDNLLARVIFGTAYWLGMSFVLLSCSQPPPTSIGLDTVQEGSLEITSLSPSGTLIATTAEDRILLFELDGQAPTTVIDTNYTAITSLSFSRDSLIVMSGHGDGTVFLWDAESGSQIDVIPDRSNDAAIYDVELSPDNTTLACASGSAELGSIALWDLETNQWISRLRGHTISIHDITWSPDNSIIASSSPWDQDIFLWDKYAGEKLATLTGHTGGVTTVAFHPHDQLLASGGGDEAVTLWDITTGKRIHSWEGLSGGVRSLALSPDGLLLAAGSRLGAIRVWDIQANQLIFSIEGQDENISDLALQADGSTLVSLSASGNVATWPIKP